MSMKRLMMNTLVAVFATTLAGYGVAQAQDEWDDDADLGGFEDEDTGFGDDMGGDMDAEPEPVAEAGDASPTGWLTGWPMQQVLRPTTLPAGGMAVGVDLDMDKGFDFVVLSPSFRYGVSDQIEAGFAYSGIFLQPDFEAAEGALLLTGAYNVMRTDNMDLSARGTFGYHLGLEALFPLVLGADFKYLLNEKMAVVVPGHHLYIGLEEPNAIILDLPVGFGFQATDNIYAQVDTSLATIGIKDADNVIFGADAIPLQVMGFFSPNNTMDIGAGISTDVKNDPGDNLWLHIAFRYYLGVE
jgi:hypothetical protein